MEIHNKTILQFNGAAAPRTRGAPRCSAAPADANLCPRERECCLLVLNLVSSTLSCIRQPRPRLQTYAQAHGSMA